MRLSLPLSPSLSFFLSLSSSLFTSISLSLSLLSALCSLSISLFLPLSFFVSLSLSLYIYICVYIYVSIYNVYTGVPLRRPDHDRRPVTVSRPWPIGGWPLMLYGSSGIQLDIIVRYRTDANILIDAGLAKVCLICNK